MSFGKVTTLKLMPLLALPLTVTTTFPVEAPAGTFATIDVSAQLTAEAVVPLNARVAGVVPKFVPVIVTGAPTTPEGGFMPTMAGGGGGFVVTVKFTPLLALPPAVTTTFPDEAPDGTAVTIDVPLQLATEAAVPLNVTVPAVEPKFVPVIVTDAPTIPEFGETLVMAGAVGDVTMVKLTPLLVLPLAVTTTFPEDAPAGTVATIDDPLQDTIMAVTPLNVTVPVVELKFVPAIVTDVPAAPEFGERLEIVGDVGNVPTVKLTPLLELPSTATTTFPDEAPDGTFTAIDESAQLTIGAVFPLNVTKPGVDPKLVPVIVTDVPANPTEGVRVVMVGAGGGGVVVVDECEVLKPQPDSRSKRKMEINSAPERGNVRCLRMNELSLNGGL